MQQMKSPSEFLPVVLDVLKMEPMIFPSWTKDFVERAEYREYQIQELLFSLDDTKKSLRKVMQSEAFEATRNALIKLEKSMDDYALDQCTFLMGISDRVELNEYNGSESYKKRIKQDFLHRHLQECIIPVPVLWTPEVQL